MVAHAKKSGGSKASFAFNNVITKDIITPIHAGVSTTVGGNTVAGDADTFTYHPDMMMLFGDSPADSPNTEMTVDDGNDDDFLSSPLFDEDEDYYSWDDVTKDITESSVPPPPPPPSTAPSSTLEPPAYTTLWEPTNPEQQKQQQQQQDVSFEEFIKEDYISQNDDHDGQLAATVSNIFDYKIKMLCYRNDQGKLTLRPNANIKYKVKKKQRAANLGLSNKWYLKKNGVWEMVSTGIKIGEYML